MCNRATLASGALRARMYGANDTALQNGIVISLKEKNPDLSDVKSSSDFVAVKKRRLALNAVGLVASVVVPPVGVGLAASKFVAAMNNERKEQRICQAIETAAVN